MNFFIEKLNEFASDPSIEDEDIDVLNSLLKVHYYKKGELIYKQGDICKEFYWVKSGFVRQYYYKNGKDITETFADENDGFGSISSLVYGEPTILEAIAMENTEIYHINREKLNLLSFKYPKVQEFYRQILEIGFAMVYKRMVLYKFESARQRYQTLLQEKPNIILKTSSIHIASYLGISPETLSRIKGD